MQFIIKVFPEIIMKSHSVRKRFMRILSDNIRRTLQATDTTVTVVAHWDYIAVNHKNTQKTDALRSALLAISGIHHVLEVEKRTYHSLDDIAEQIYQAFKEQLINKSFCVRVKRRGNHTFSSMDVMRHVGGVLNQRIDSARVQLTNPDITVHVEIDHDSLLLIKARHAGLGGFPMGTQEDVLSLISGGFDSAVASFMLMRRGSRVHYCFFNLGGNLHEIGVKQMSYHLWQRYSLSHKVKFISIDFQAVVAEILGKIDDGQMGVVLKRMMVKAASQVAQRFGIQALVTGEALGQVASQTLTNLGVIDQAASVLILRPLIAYDKEEIIRLNETIGTFELAKNMPEFCGVISKSPTVKAKMDKVLATEQGFDFAILQQAIDNAQIYDIKSLAESKQDDIILPDYAHQVADNEMVIDIRSPDEQDELPLCLAGVPSHQILSIPFYQLQQKFAHLDPHITYLLYCKQGVMSRLQAVQLLASGYQNLKVLLQHT